MIPASKGKGFIRGMRPNEHLGILIANYHLYEEIAMQSSIHVFKTSRFAQAKDIPSYLLFQFKNCLSTAEKKLGSPHCTGFHNECLYGE